MEIPSLTRKVAWPMKHQPELIVPVVDTTGMLEVVGSSEEWLTKRLRDGRFATHLVPGVMSYIFNYIDMDQKGWDGYFACNQQTIENRCLTKSRLQFQLSIKIGGGRICTPEDLQEAYIYKDWYCICDVRYHPNWLFYLVPTSFLVQRTEEGTLTEKGWGGDEFVEIMEKYFDIKRLKVKYLDLVEQSHGREFA